MTCSLRSAEKGVISIWWSIIEYCSFLFHSFVNTRSGRVESRSGSWFASFFHHKWPTLGWSVPSLTPLGEDASTGHICCRLTDSSAASNLCVMKICVWFLLYRNHPASTTQFSSSAERRAVLAALWWIGMTLASLPCFCFAERVITASLLSLCCAQMEKSYGFHAWVVQSLIWLTTPSCKTLWRKIIWVQSTVTQNPYTFCVGHSLQVKQEKVLMKRKKKICLVPQWFELHIASTSLIQVLYLPFVWVYQWLLGTWAVGLITFSR